MPGQEVDLEGSEKPDWNRLKKRGKRKTGDTDKSFEEFLLWGKQK
jgi:hypothetical protein